MQERTPSRRRPPPVHEFRIELAGVGRCNGTDRGGGIRQRQPANKAESLARTPRGRTVYMNPESMADSSV